MVLYTCVSVSACLLLLSLLTITDGHVGSLCRPNERFLSCGACQKTCSNPAPACAGVCNEGCFCEEDQVRNEEGVCVKLQDCPPSEILAAYKKETTEPLPNEMECPENEEYRFCEPCNRSCEQPHVVCPAQCARGCFCKGNLLRDKDGQCVEPEKCSNAVKTVNSKPVQPIPYKYSSKARCGPNMVFKECEKCEKTCLLKEEKCEEQCAPGCYCDEGFFRSPTEQCVAAEECPAVSQSSHELTVEDCLPTEVFLSCGWCEATCREPRPRCTTCTRGCLCRPPLLRHRNGHCVPEKNCALERCAKGESFTCLYGCEPRCDARCEMRRKRRRTCTLGCYCTPGLFRDNNGTCVPLHECTAPNSTVKLPRSNREIFESSRLETTLLINVLNDSETEQQELCAEEETFSCLSGCEARCDMRCEIVDSNQCTRGCHCKRNLYRNDSGNCVPLHLCENTFKKRVIRKYVRGNSIAKSLLFSSTKSLVNVNGKLIIKNSKKSRTIYF